MLDYFTGDRSWHEFYALLGELPPWSKFRSALAMDRDHALYLHEKQRLAREAAEERDENEDDEDEANWKPTGKSPEGYTPELDALYTLDERLQSLARILIMVNSKTKPPEVQKHKRPVTALDLLDLEDEREEMSDLAAAFGLKK